MVKNEKDLQEAVAFWEYLADKRRKQLEEATDFIVYAYLHATDIEEVGKEAVKTLKRMNEIGKQGDK